eukprot:scaffold99803_cov41-Prasinocladus_malaysianus.AAC.1
MALLRALLMDSQIGASTMEDVFTSGSSVRLFVNATSRMIEAAARTQSTKPTDSERLNGQIDTCCPLAGWAVAMQRLPAGATIESLCRATRGSQACASVQEAGRLAVSLKRRVTSWQQSDSGPARRSA